MNYILFNRIKDDSRCRQAENRETGERPVRSRHCKREAVA